jgi:hypothetical protein
MAMKHFVHFREATLALVVALLAGCAATPPATPPTVKPRVERAADLPRFSYRIDGKLEDVMRDPARFAAFAAQVRRDTLSVLNGYDIPDKGTRRDLLTQLAILDYLDGNYTQALARAEQVRALEDKPSDKLLSGMRLRAMAAAAQRHGPRGPAFERDVGEALARELAPMPYNVVQNDVKEMKAGAELMGETLVLGRLREVWQPMVDTNGTLSSDIAPGVVGTRFRLIGTLPLKKTLVDVFSNYLAAHKVVKPDIWAARDVTLASGLAYKPVPVAVWDSGVDMSLYKNQLALDGKGQPALVAFDKYSRPSDSAMEPIPPALRSRLPQMAAQTKGFSDLQSDIDSPEASAVKSFLSTLTREQYKPAIEEIRLAGNYEHGTHVAGITLAGNPYARLVVGRIEFGHTLKPDPCPSREQAERDAKAAQATVDYFVAQSVRVVNMSWGGSVADTEGDLEQCGIGKSQDERKALARELFEIQRSALTKAFASAPQILFVAAAGNENADSTFGESIPAAIVLPNLLTVGAVDRAGDEASFTSYGPTVKVHANGYQVESFLPGGSRVALSGTSMASPQVANLAAKLLAVNPALTPGQLIQRIVATAEATPDGRRRLIDPKKALAEAGR